MKYNVLATYVVAVTLSVVSFFAAVIISDRSARETDQESNRKWCAVLVPIDEGYQHAPPTTETGRTFAINIHTLRLQFECEQNNGR